MCIVPTNGPDAQAAGPATPDEGRERVERLDKRITTLVAELTLRGYTVHLIAPERLQIMRWGWVRELSLDEADELLGRLGARRA